MENQAFSLGVSLSDYAVKGMENMAAADMMELEKALQATELRGSDTSATSGAPLKVESLENTLKITTFQEGDIQFWKRVPKLPAFNTVEEYNQMTSVGSDRGGFNNEGELPEEEDSTYLRKAQLVKFLGVTKSVTHPMQLVNTMVGNIIQRETKNGTLWILRKADKALTFGDADVIPQEWNGLLKQHFDGFGGTLDQYWDSNSVVDLRGKALTEAAIEQGGLGILENYGFADLLMAPPVVLSNFVKRFHESKLIQPNTPAITAGVMGQRVKTFASQFGDIELGYDKFMKANPLRYITAGKLSPKAPDAVIPDGVAPVATIADGSSRFSGFNGDYFYAVSPVNRYGEGPLTALKGTLTTVAATESFNLKFADGGGTYSATGYVIYRSKKTPTTTLATTPMYPLFSVSVAQMAAGYDGGAAGLVRDRNKILPDCDQAIMIQNSEEIYSFKQLAPLMKMDLAILSPAIRFMILLYGTPQLYAPRKFTRFVNVGGDLS
jgi:hypothetical protein